MRAKSWLYEQGHIAADGRGRMPRVSVKNGREIAGILDEAYQSGTKFSDWPKGVVAEVKAAVKPKAETTDTGVVDLAPYRFPEDEFKALEVGTKKERSLREACRNCRNSLVGCWCVSPEIVATNGNGSVKVRIVPRPEGEPNPWIRLRF